MAKKILGGVAVVIVLLIVVVAVQPAEYHVERSTQIEAPAELVWAQVSDFNQWKNWSHWEKADPTQKTTITGDPGTVGHKTSWEGEKTGVGTMTITEATAPTQMVINLEFEEPMASVATTAMNLESKGEGTGITWSMDGKNNFVGKFFTLTMGGMDKMVGTAYEESLANVKTIAEENAKNQMEEGDEAADTEEVADADSVIE